MPVMNLKLLMRTLQTPLLAELSQLAAKHELPEQNDPKDVTTTPRLCRHVLPSNAVHSLQAILDVNIPPLVRGNVMCRLGRPCS